MFKLKLSRWLMIVLMPLWLGGCAATSGDYCQLARPIWFDSQDDVTRTPIGVKRQILTHNETIVKVCR